MSLKNIEADNGLLRPRLVGVNKASTFNGFCSKHDDAIFAPLEKAVFTSTPEQCFLLGYRALALELYRKRASSDLSQLRRTLDRGRSASDQRRLQRMLTAFEEGTNAGVRDALLHKRRYDEVLTSSDWEPVRAYTIELAEAPPVMCAGGKLPTFDFDNNRLQDLSRLDELPAEITCTSFWGGERGAVVFAWLADSDAVCIPFVKSLHSISNAEMTRALVAYFFSSFENLCIAPDWWESLDQATTDRLVRLLAASAAFVEEASPRGQEKYLQVPPWTFLARTPIGFTL